MVNGQITKLDDHFSAISGEIKEILKIKKEAFIKMYQKDPRISRDEAVFSLQKMVANINTFNPEEPPAFENIHLVERKRILTCEYFSGPNYNVTVSSCKRSVRYIGGKTCRFGSCGGYCFIGHPKIDKNKILTWSLSVPMLNCFIGIVMNYKLYFLVYSLYIDYT